MGIFKRLFSRKPRAPSASEQVSDIIERFTRATIQGVDPEDIEGLETLLKAAHQNAMEKVRKEMPALGGGAGGGMPGMPDLGSFGF